MQNQNAQVETAYRFINRGRLSAGQAINALRQYRPTATADIAEMYRLRGFAEMTTAENFCNGAPLTDATGENRIWELTNSAGRWTVADDEGGNGLPFVRANDPRVPTCRGGTPGCRNVVPSGNGFDGVTPLFGQLLWPTRESSLTVISGVEAELIQAEAQLKAGDAAGILATLNGLQANTALYRCSAANLVTAVPSCQASPTALTPLTDLGSQRAREDLLFRERAFWLFSTGHRLPDLRRLIRQYGRTRDPGFAVGTHPREPGPYGTDVNFPVPQAEQNNPNVKGCTDRNA